MTTFSLRMRALFLLVGLAWLVFCWQKTLTFAQGSVAESPYFLLTIFSTLLCLITLVRFVRFLYEIYFSGSGDAWLSSGGGDDIVSRLQHEKAFLGAICGFLCLLFLYLIALRYLGFWFSSCAYLGVQSLWLRQRVTPVDLTKPVVWVKHLVYAVLLTIGLGFFIWHFLGIQL